MGEATDAGGHHLLDDLPGAVLAIDDDGFVRYANPAAKMLLGGLGDVGSPLGLPVSSGGFLELRTEPERIVEVRTAPSEFEGEPVTIVLLHDVTDMESSRTRLQDNMDAFEFALGITAHELRNPLAVLLAALDTLVDRGGVLDGDELARLHPRMRWHANRMRVLVDNTLAVTSGASHLQVVQEKVDLAGTVDGYLRHASDPSRFRMDVADDGSPLEVWATKRHLEQIVLNLIGNAEKYGEPPFEFSFWRQDGVVAMQLRDHGDGVAEELRERIFERYVRADAAGRRSGTGLGLWVCRELARRNGGDIVYVADGTGAAFRVTLPSAPNASTTATTGPAGEGT